MEYKCYFVFVRGDEIKRCYTKFYTLSNFKDGFWVNEYLQFTNGSDAKYWIPPSVITLIEKCEV